MKARTQYLVAGLLIVLIAVVSAAVTGAADTSATTGVRKLNWTLHLNDTRGPIRTADLTAVTGKTAVTDILGGPTSGSVNAYILYTRMAPGAKGPALFTLPVEDDYVVTQGKMTVQIGTDTFEAGPMDGVVIPAGTPHAFWNAGDEQEANLEVITSATPQKDLSRDLMSMLKPAAATKVDNAANCIRKIDLPKKADLKAGLNRQVFTNRAKGSPITMALDTTNPGSGGPAPHVHPFEQAYFMLEGETQVMYGIDNPTASKGDLVVLPIGVVHTNTNRSTNMERHITLLLPQNTSGPADVEFKMGGPAGGNVGAGPGPMSSK